MQKPLPPRWTADQECGDARGASVESQQPGKLLTFLYGCVGETAIIGHDRDQAIASMKGS